MSTEKMEPVAWISVAKHSNQMEFCEPNEKATNPKYWTDAIPLYTVSQLQAAVAAERERCAKFANEYLTNGRSPLGKSVAAAIRQLGDEQ